MRPQEMNTALDVQREAGALPDVGVVYANASPMMGAAFNHDEIELDMRQASAASKSMVREIASKGWKVEEGDDYWTLTSDYYPKTPEEMLEVRDPTEETDA